MPLVYITGPTGSGKSTIAEKLKELNYEVYDTDTNGIRYWLDQTGEPVKTFQKRESHSTEWLKDHRLGLPKSWLVVLRAKNPDKPVFVCGTSPVDHVEEGIYDKVICLVVDEQTLINRVKVRTNNQYGKDPKQLGKAIKWRQATIDRYKNVGALEIDATLSPKEIVNKILKEIT